MKRFFILGLMIASIGGYVMADDSVIREEISDLKAKISSIESATSASSAAAGGDISTLTTIKKTGSVAIGGDVNIDLMVKRREDSTSEGDYVNSTEFDTNSANLRFKVSASPDSYLYIKLDLDDAWNANADQDDLLEECKFVWNSVRGSNFGFVFGKGEVPYGQDKTLGIIQSFHHNDETYSSEGPGFILAGTEEVDTARGNPHNNVGRVSHPGEVDNVFMVGASYIYKNFLKVELSLFQNNDSTSNGRTTRGMHEDRSDDNLFFNSFAARLWLQPIENLQVEASFIREYNDSAGDTTANGKNAEEAQYAASLGFDYKIANLPLEVFGEYQHGWDWNYTDDYDTDTYQLGLVWSVTSQLDLGFMGEWLSIDDENNGADEDYARLVLSSKYTLDNGMFFILEYGHEWWDGDFKNAADGEREGDLIAFRSGWAF